jgi:hypothetical protein
MKTYTYILKLNVLALITIFGETTLLSQTNTGTEPNSFDLELYEQNYSGNTKFGSEINSLGDLNGDGYDDFLCSSIFNTYVFYGGINPDSIPDIVLNIGEVTSSYGDINNDGFADLVISDDNEVVYIYFGGTNMDAVADIVLENPGDVDEFGCSLSCNGDLNNDGYDDIVVGACGRWNQKGLTYAYLGGREVDNLPDVILEGKIDRRGYFGAKLSSEGDLNNDGCNDLIVNESDSLYVFYGGEYMDSISDITLLAGREFSLGGDINNDGFDDIICGDITYNDYKGRAFIYFGGVDMDTIIDVDIKGTVENSWLGIGVSLAGDVNNDGFDDFTVGELKRNSGSTISNTLLYYGSDSPDILVDMNIEGGVIKSNSDYKAASAGDINNDGFSDIMIADRYWNSETGKASVYWGGSNMDTIADLVVEGRRNNNQFGYSVASAGDINNDNYDDLLVAAYGYESEDKAGRVYVYLGSNEPDTIVDHVLEYVGSGRFGRCVAPAGDMNNDGYDDFIVSGGGQALIYFGDTVIKDVPDKIFFQNVNDFAIDVASAGDLNNDGYDDVIIGSKMREYKKGGSAYIYFGGEDMDTIVDLVLKGDFESINYFGSSVSSAGDVNNDGYDDVIVGAYLFPSNGRAYIYYGGETMDDCADVVLQGQASYGNFGYSVSSAGDVNNDGYDDVIVGVDYWVGSYVYFGGSNMDHTPDIVLSNGQSVSSAGDVNNDGYDDVIVGSYRANSYEGECSIYYGGADMDDTADLVFTGQNEGDYLGYSLASAGDINNDGNSDIIVGAYRHDLLCGRAYVYYGEVPVVINEQPQGVEICAGSITEFTVDATDASEYQWQVKTSSDTIFRNVRDNALYSNSATQALTVYTNDTLSGNEFRCEVKNEYQTKYSDAATLKVNSIPTVTNLGDTLFCYGDIINQEISLTGTAPWSLTISNEKNQVDISCDETPYSMSIDSIGLYTIIAVNDSNCIDTAISKPVSFAINPLPTSNLFGDTTLCKGEIAILEVHLTGNSPWAFQLSNSSIVQNYTANDSIYIIETDSSGIYSIISLNDAYCQGKQMTGNATIKVNPAPTSMLCGSSYLCKEDSTEICILFTGKAPWVFTLSDGVENTEYYSDKNPYSFYLDTIGVYSVMELRDANCPGVKMEGEVTLDKCASMEQTLKKKMRIYPNPNNGSFAIDNLEDITKLEVLNLMGQIVHTQKVNSSTIKVELSEKFRGIHILKLSGHKITIAEMIYIK